jgi:hypothetical protein
MAAGIDRPAWRLGPLDIGPSMPVQPSGRDRDGRRPEHGKRRQPRSKTPQEPDDGVAGDGSEPLPEEEQRRRVDIVA